MDDRELKGAVYLGTIIFCLAAWFTHVVSTIMAEKFLLLIAGAIVFPVGVIHGIGIWLGVW